MNVFHLAHEGETDFSTASATQVFCTNYENGQNPGHSGSRKCCATKLLFGLGILFVIGFRRGKIFFETGSQDEQDFIASD